MNDSENKKIKMPNDQELLISSSPHVHSNESISKVMMIVVAALVPALFAGIYFWGMQAAYVLINTTIGCLVLEAICCKIAKKDILKTLKDGSAIVTGLLLGMNLAAGTPWWVCAVGSFLAIVIAKHIFGGIGNNPFNPALVARVGLFLGFSGQLSRWVPTGQMLKFQSALDKAVYNSEALANIGRGAFDEVTCATPLAMAKEKAVDVVTLTSNDAFWDYFIGNIGGCIGETSALALIAGGIILIIFRLIRWQIPVCFIGTVMLIAFFATIADPAVSANSFAELITAGLRQGAIFHALTGGLMLGAIFMATDMTTSPTTKKGAIIYAIGCGVITALIRLWCGYPEGVSFSILIMNALVPVVDRITLRKPFGFIKTGKEIA